MYLDKLRSKLKSKLIDLLAEEEDDMDSISSESEGVFEANR